MTQNFQTIIEWGTTQKIIVIFTNNPLVARRLTKRGIYLARTDTTDGVISGWWFQGGMNCIRFRRDKRILTVDERDFRNAIMESVRITRIENFIKSGNQPEESPK